MNLAKKYFYVLTGIVVFIIYLFTLAPSVMQIDSGELAAVQSTLGIAHPTGYPLYTIVGYLFGLIPFPTSKIFQLNILASIYCSVGISTFVYTAKLVLDNLESFSTTNDRLFKPPKKKKPREKGNMNKNKAIPTILESVKYIVSITCGLVLAFSVVYWLQSTSVEVYSLHILLINFIILFLIKGFLFGGDNNNQVELKFWIIFSAFLALGFSNHMTTILLIPGVAYLFFVKYKLTSVSVKKILIMLVVFFPILFLIYLYLPIRASQNPVINWGNPVDLEKIIRHITGKQYQVWLFTSTASA
ncbi:MAG: DUF2723 domain-containing protein, partial [Ignavibacteriaceae bacterium]